MPSPLLSDEVGKSHSTLLDHLVTVVGAASNHLPTDGNPGFIIDAKAQISRELNRQDQVANGLGAAQDRNGNIWIPTFGDGIYEIRRLS